MKDLLIIGVALLVVFIVVPQVVDDIVPSVVHQVIGSIERVVMSIANRTRPPAVSGGERIKQLETAMTSLSASVRQLAVAERALVEHVTATREKPATELPAHPPESAPGGHDS